MNQVDPNEHLLSAAKREVMEETGVEVEVDGIVRQTPPKPEGEMGVEVEVDGTAK